MPWRVRVGKVKRDIAESIRELSPTVRRDAFTVFGGKLPSRTVIVSRAACAIPRGNLTARVKPRFPSTRDKRHASPRLPTAISDSKSPNSLRSLAANGRSCIRHHKNGGLAGVYPTSYLVFPLASKMIGERLLFTPADCPLVPVKYPGFERAIDGRIADLYLCGFQLQPVR